MTVMVMLEDIICLLVLEHTQMKQGTIDYSTGQVTLNSLNVSSISNIRGSSTCY